MSVVVDQVLARAVKAVGDTAELSDAARGVGAAALLGQAELTAAIETIPESVAPPAQAEMPDAGSASSKIYLTKISACGFRGIADRVELDLAPGPGLVLVTGRNGSGKSSLAEAAEFALVGESERTKSTLWREGITNLHYEGDAEIRVELLVDGVGRAELGYVFTTDSVDNARPLDGNADPAASAVIDEGWHEAIQTYRPILTYTELAKLTSPRQSELFDPINRLLGLDGLTQADKCLTSEATAQRRTKTEASSALKSLLADLDGIADDRAAELRAALAGKPDLDAANRILTGSEGQAASDRAVLGQWADLAMPTVEKADELVDRLRAARDAERVHSMSAAGRARQLADLLELAIAHRAGPDDRCPVCGEGVLHDEWLTSARQELADARQQAAEATSASTELAAARRAIQEAVPGLPPVLAKDAIGTADPAPTRTAWQALVGLADGEDPTARDDALIAGLTEATRVLTEAGRALAQAAEDERIAADASWQPLAERAGVVVAQQRGAAVAAERLAALTDARTWLQKYTEGVRQERLGEFADEATGIWAGLRQESNVSLEGLTLTGTNTRREVRLDLSVDGTPGSRAVLSQGELAALGLALFLPRSAAEDSPFHFILIDDPVQSMDPSKIDGLARVLSRLAEKRQVVVFTHDDRLWQALKRLALPATCYYIERAERSVVAVRHVTDAVDQYLRDADALSRDNRFPADLAALATAGYCRDAVDEAALDLARRKLLAAGRSISEIEDTLQRAQTTRHRLALALLGDASKSGRQLDSELKKLGDGASTVVEACVEGVHEPDTDRVAAVVSETKTLVGTLKAMG